MQKSRGLVLGAVGDRGFQGALSAGMHARGVDWPFQRVAPLLARADLLFGNRAENQNVMREVVAMARERWEQVIAGDNTYGRPGWRMRRP